MGSGTLAGSAMCEICVSVTGESKERLVGAERIEPEPAPGRIARDPA